MVLREELSEYAERSSSLIEESPQMDEQNTKRKIIEPIIELLGWDILSSDVELEYSVQMGAGTKKVDYALKFEGTPVIFVEAKGCDSTLEKGHEDQLKSYMRQVGVDWGLLSNGRQFKIFRRDSTSNRPNEISLAEFSIDNVVENIHPLKALSRGSITTGESQQIAEKIESVQKAIKTLRKNKEDVAEDVTRVVTSVVGESVSQRIEDEAKSFVDDLMIALEEQAHQTEVPRKIEEPSTDSGAGYVIRLTRDGSEITRFSGNSQAGTVSALVEYLIEEEGLMEKVELPYIPGTGRGNRALLNDEPKHTNGEEMRMYEPLSGGYYLFTALSAKDKIRYIPELSEKVGLECEFSNGW